MNNAFSLTKIIGGLSKTLNIVNQLIPLYNQVKPYIGKANQMINNINNLNINKPKQQTLKIQNTTNPPPQINLPTFFQ